MKKVSCGNLTQQSQISSSTTTKSSHRIIICNTTTTLKQNTFSHVPQHAPPTQILQENQHQIPYHPPSSPLPFPWEVEGFILANFLLVHVQKILMIFCYIHLMFLSCIKQYFFVKILFIKQGFFPNFSLKDFLLQNIYIVEQ